MGEMGIGRFCVPSKSKGWNNGRGVKSRAPRSLRDTRIQESHPFPFSFAFSPQATSRGFRYPWALRQIPVVFFLYPDFMVGLRLRLTLSRAVMVVGLDEFWKCVRIVCVAGISRNGIAWTLMPYSMAKPFFSCLCFDIAPSPPAFSQGVTMIQPQSDLAKWMWYARMVQNVALRLWRQPFPIRQGYKQQHLGGEMAEMLPKLFPFPSKWGCDALWFRRTHMCVCASSLTQTSTTCLLAPYAKRNFV
ncbi:hypothetical protein B0J11DRAFT_152450 [Dendryphion nanum]|uniref:Uncharacterized protein n=1 Tax=Dendryphion nanum TaxID=256645 RepID=A0A9P9ITS1_9PLEO|nr:hypothetical protein B0J11DRAFT_152450 [Dendryphion nanum]